MPETGHVAVVSDAINKEVQHVMASEQFEKWLEGDPPKPDDLVVFNNTIFHRSSGMKTVKNKKYLCIRPSHDNKSAESTWIIEPSTGINNIFRRFSGNSAQELSIKPIKDSLKSELRNLGLIVFALVGKIGEDEPADVTIKNVTKFDTLSYYPTQSKTVEMIEEIISVNRLDDVDVVWRSVQEEAIESGFDLPGQFVEKFRSAFTALRELAHRPVNVDHTDTENSILGEAIKHIDQQISAYASALSNHLNDPEDINSINDLLRISYNFADGTQELLSLVVGTCDMKPVIFWLTFGAQLDLAIQLSKIPVVLEGGKPSIQRYRSAIANARNHTFHNIFAFGRPFRVRLTGDAFSSAELHLFREYAKRNESALYYTDQKLVDLLQGFTRAPESSVPFGFWESNLEVMRAVGAMARSLRTALITLSEDG